MVSYLFFISGLQAKKFYTYIIAAIPAIPLAIIGLNATYNCSYFLTVITPLFIILGFLLHGIRVKLPIPFKIAISLLCMVPIIVIAIYMNNVKAENSFNNSNLLSLAKEENPVDVTDRYTGLISYIKSENLPVSYITDSIVNEITVISDDSVNVAPISSIENFSRLDETTDSFANPYDLVRRDTKPFYLIFDNDTLSKYKSSLYLKFGESVYSDSYYTVYSYKNLSYFNDTVFQNNMIDLAAQKYDSFYYSFQNADIKDPKDFPLFSGTNPIFIHPSTNDYENINVLLAMAIEKEGIKNVFFELDTVALTSGDGRSELDYIDKMIDKYSDVTFFITLGYPTTSYWRSLGEDERKKTITSYEEVIKALSHNDNILFFAPGSEKWLVEIKGNYPDGAPSEEVAYSILVTSVCNRMYTVDKTSVEAYEKELTELIDENIKYPNLSDYELVFFGDSILGNYHGSLSIPGLAEGLSDCKSYNLGIGGTGATADFNDIADYFLGNTGSVRWENEEFEKEFARFKEENDPSKKKIFVINYGVNDYFSGIPAKAGSGTPYEDYTYDSYETAMKEGISKLKAAYPDCEVCIIAPIYCDYFDSGKEIKSSVGSPLETYREVGKSVADEMGLMWLDSNTLIPIDSKNHKTYLVDGVHPTNDGLYLISRAIVKFLGKDTQEQK